MRLAPLLIGLAVIGVASAVFLVLRDQSPSDATTTQLDPSAPPARDDARRPARKARDRVRLPTRAAPLDDAARELLRRAREDAANGRELEALLVVRPPRVAEADWLAPYQEEFAAWEVAVLDDLEGDATAGRAITDSELGQAQRALLLPASQERLRALLERLGATASAADQAVLAGFETAVEREAIERHLARFGRAANQATADAPTATPVDEMLRRVAARAWKSKPLPIADPASAEDRRVAQLERLRARGVTSLLDRIAAGLAWLALHQADDGSFSKTSLRCVKLHAKGEVCGAKRKDPKRALAATSLAALAFLDFRDQDARGLFEPNLARAVLWLRRQQRQDGGFGRESYDAALALMALGQAAASSGDAAVGDAVTRAWNAYEQTAGPRGGYRYVAKQEGDLSVTAWVAQAYEAARAAGIDVPSASARLALRDFVRSTWDGRDRFTYLVGGSPRPSLQSAGMLALHVLGEVESEELRKHFADVLSKSAPASEKRKLKYNLYGLYYDVRMELLLADDLTPGRRDEVLAFAAEFQETAGFETGMFDPEPEPRIEPGGKKKRPPPKDRWVSRGGFTAFTAFALLTLEHTLFRR